MSLASPSPMGWHLPLRPALLLLLAAVGASAASSQSHTTATSFIAASDSDATEAYMPHSSLSGLLARAFPAAAGPSLNTLNTNTTAAASARSKLRSTLDRGILDALAPHYNGLLSRAHELHQPGVAELLQVGTGRGFMLREEGGRHAATRRELVTPKPPACQHPSRRSSFWCDVAHWRAFLCAMCYLYVKRHVTSPPSQCATHACRHLLSPQDLLLLQPSPACNSTTPGDGRRLLQQQEQQPQQSSSSASTSTDPEPRYPVPRPLPCTLCATNSPARLADWAARVGDRISRLPPAMSYPVVRRLLAAAVVRAWLDGGGGPLGEEDEQAVQHLFVQVGKGWAQVAYCMRPKQCSTPWRRGLAARTSPR